MVVVVVVEGRSTIVCGAEGTPLRSTSWPSAAECIVTQASNPMPLSMNWSNKACHRIECTVSVQSYLPVVTLWNLFCRSAESCHFSKPSSTQEYAEPTIVPFEWMGEWTRTSPSPSAPSEEEMEKARKECWIRYLITSPLPARLIYHVRSSSF